MSKKKGQKFTLDQPATYQIKVPGEIDMSRFDWIGGITVNSKHEDDSDSISILTGNLDQAALQGLLRRLYSLGIPLISVACIDQDMPGNMEGAQK